MSKKFTCSFVLSSFVAVVSMTTPTFGSPGVTNNSDTFYGSNVAETKKKKTISSVRKKSTSRSVSLDNFKSASSVRGRYNAGPRPGRWCGWWMRTQFGGGPEYNLARNWAKRGVNAGGPQVGVVVVWRGHVGLITGRAANGQWIVKSGNDSNQVRERPRSLKHRTGNPIAYRFV